MSSSKIEFGFNTTPEGRNFLEMKRLCLLTEDAGYSSFVIPDHFQSMSRPDELGAAHPLEAWTLLSGLAAVTSKIRLGPLVSCVHYRHPTVLAKMATTVDIVSGGRLIFGVGAGWHQREFEGFLGDFPSAKKRLDGLEDALNIAKSMFINERTNYKGKIYSAKNTLNLPLPIQRPIPIMVGGFGLKRTLKIAAKYSNISHFSFDMDEQTVETRINALKEHCRTVGRDYNEITKSISMLVDLNPTLAELEEYARRTASSGKITIEEAKRIVEKTYGAPEGIRDAINRYASKGICLFFLNFKHEEDIRPFAEKIMKKI